MNRSDLTKLKTAKGGSTSVETPEVTVKGPNSATAAANVDSPTITIKGPQAVVVARNHASLDNLDFENSGHKGFAGIQFGTTAEWNSDPTFVPALGMLIVYTDYATADDGHGNIIYYPNFKIGDGNAYLIDKPFVGDDMRKTLSDHINNKVIHITQEEREFWNNKLNYEEPEGDLLTFTRD